MESAVRRAVSLLEVIIAIAILAVLMGLLLPAIQKVRQSAVRTQDKNNLKQIALALQHYSSSSEGRLPGKHVPSIIDSGRFGNVSPLYNILPFLDAGLPPYAEVRSQVGVRYFPIKVYLSPSDPTIPVHEAGFDVDGATSYPANGQVFSGFSHTLTTITDGLSNTIGFSQRYYRCQNRFNYTTHLMMASCEAKGWPCRYEGTRAGTFADPDWQDVVPVTNGSLPTSRGSRGGAPFQVVPAPRDADGSSLQATQSGGLLAAMLDGRVRSFSPSVADSVFWSAVTPAAGELFGDE